MEKTPPKPISTTDKKIEEFRTLNEVTPSPKCFEGSLSKQLGHLSVIKRKGKMSDEEIKTTKKVILD